MSDIILTEISKKPMSFTLPVVGAAGAFAGLLVGTAQGSGLVGLVAGALLLAALAYVALEISGSDRERPFKYGLLALFLVAGYGFGSLPGLVIGGLFGWFFGWFIFWLGEGRYRAKLPPYLTSGQVLWHYTFRVICGAIFIFLITPILVVMPLSFNAENFFTFTPEMLRFDPAGYSLKHYRDFFQSNDWQSALRNSLMIAPAATMLSVSLRHAGRHRPQPAACAVPPRDHGDPDLSDDRAPDHFCGRDVFLLLADRPAGHLSRAWCWLMPRSASRSSSSP